MKIGYVRVSDDHQNDQMQIDALRAAGCAVIYGDHGVSGSVTARKGLDALLQDLSAGDTLMVWKLDRLGRSTVHLLLLLDKLRQRHVDFVSLTQGIDTTTAIGRMVFGQLAVFAEFEREQIRERTRAGMAAAKRRGKHIGRPSVLSDAQIDVAIHQLEERAATISGMAQAYGVAPVTLSRAIKRRSISATGTADAA